MAVFKVDYLLNCVWSDEGTRGNQREPKGTVTNHLKVTGICVSGYMSYPYVCLYVQFGFIEEQLGL